jgi:TolB-like protein/AraC-like DNA-binding protein/Flp pilus assembly protein TadD
MGQGTPRDVRAAVALIRTTLRRPITIAELADHCGVAKRTLNEHFRGIFGISPIRYQRQLRLAAVREELLQSKADTTVTEIAEKFGFNHFGRFAGQYRKIFGETPSMTLRRARQMASKGYQGFSKARSADTPMPRPQILSREKPSLAVLPCRIAAESAHLGWLTESLAEVTTVALGSHKMLSVVAPQSFRSGERNPQRAAREFHVRYVLMGRLLKSRSQLRVILQLIDSVTGKQVWGDSYDGSIERVLELQDLIVAGVSRAILPSIRGAEIDRARRMFPEDLDAYGATMCALPLIFSSQPESTDRALELLSRTLERDPDYGLANALAAWGHAQRVMYNATSTPNEDQLAAHKLVQRAAILDDGDPLGLAAQCAVHTMAGEFETAEILISRALAINSNFGWAWGRRGWLHSYKGDSETAIDHFTRALALDANEGSRANNFAGIGSAHFNAERYEQAAFWLRRALSERPGMWWANRSLSVSYIRAGQRMEAFDALNALRRARSDLTVGKVVSAIPFRQDFLNRLGEGLTDLGLPT